MDKILEAFTKISIEKKALILVGIITAMILGDYFFITSAQYSKKEELKQSISNLQIQLMDQQKKAEDISGYRREVERLEQRLREAEEQLPKKSEIPKLLKDIEYEGQQSGLSMIKFAPAAENKTGSFAAVPVSMSVIGSYHEIAVFLDRIAKLPRIVNVTDLALSGPKLEDNKIFLNARYTATTYRFLEGG